eukprot:CAMPEP_0185022548 /NCGR_PEP_ID=MMETSP1103-20130426/5253_1 /TAXON_ID=36769 /ORGANISM="Paraphysomonas bandaiensis, Strain Caron Lab Isolate" /LENGTH=360 /DNA_ID=CAMNT_0027554659 /DNA_START=65 /DNA_END=1143 /DNA_ORIENTATION=-
MSSHFNKHLPASNADVDSLFPKYHRCIDSGEAYSAAYFITRAHLLETKTNYTLERVNCEMGSFIMMNQRRHMKPGMIGAVTQSLDVLDFSVIHLSGYERLIRRYWGSLRSQRLFTTTTSNDVAKNIGKATAQVLATMPERSRMTMNVSNKLNRTVAIMPFLGSTVGAGHSVLANRYEYLKACFWSIYAHISHIVVAVTSSEDYKYCRHKSGLPFFDVLLLDNLPKVAALPVATSIAVKDRLIDGRYDFDYIYFTESDQILLMRRPQDLFDILHRFPRYVLLPHRLVTYPKSVMKGVVRRPVVSVSDPSMDWVNMSCCLPRQNCQSRVDWVGIKSNNVSVLPMFNLNVALGNANFILERFR